MARIRTLPLGIDLGSTRIRIACMEQHRNGDVQLRAVACRDLPGSDADGLTSQPELLGAIVEQMLGELGQRERRCVIALGLPNAVMRSVQLPSMTRGERLRAARFEAQRFVDWNMEEERTIVRAHRADRDSQMWAIGAVKAHVLESRVAAFAAAGLRVVGVDHDTLAYDRAIGKDRTIIDVGAARSALHAVGPTGILCRSIPSGGAQITRGIADDLSIDLQSAERRKRILGVAGAGGAARTALIAQLAAMIADARLKGTRVALTGNGARLAGLATELEQATGVLVDLPVADAMIGEAYPDDVLRSASPDWMLAVGLAMHGCAA